MQITTDTNGKQTAQAKVRRRKVQIAEQDDGRWLVQDLTYGTAHTRDTAAQALSLVRGQDNRATKRDHDVAVTHITWVTRTRLGKQVVNALISS